MSTIPGSSAGAPSPQGDARYDQHPARDTGSRSRATVAPAAPLRRRRAAADALPALEDGIRDPLDRLAGLPAPERAVDYTGYDVTDLGLTCEHGAACTGHSPAAA